MQYFPHLCILHKKFIKFNYKIKSKKNMKKFKVVIRVLNKLVDIWK